MRAPRAPSRRRLEPRAESSSWSRAPPSLVFGGRPERGERAIPEAVQIRAQAGEAGRIDAVKAPRARALGRDEACALEHAQVLRDGGPAHRQPGGELAHRERAAAEPLEDRPPRRVA